MRIWIWIAALALIAGCNKTSSPTPDNTGSGTTTTGGTVTADGGGGLAAPFNSGSGVGSVASTNPFVVALGRLGDMKTRMCACTDAGCAAKIMDEYKAWRIDMKKATVGKKPTKEQDGQGNQLDKDLRACRTNAEKGITNVGVGSGAGSGTGDPMDVSLTEYETYQTRMCACTSKVCADDVQTQIAAWERATRTKLGATKPNSVQKVRAQGIETAIKDCRKKAEAATPGAPGGNDKVEAMLVKMASFRDKACACKDKACIDGVDKEVTTWQQQVGKDLADAKPTKDQDARADKLVGDMKACAAKLK